MVVVVNDVAYNVLYAFLKLESVREISEGMTPRYEAYEGMKLTLEKWLVYEGQFCVVTGLRVARLKSCLKKQPPLPQYMYTHVYKDCISGS